MHPCIYFIYWGILNITFFGWRDYSHAILLCKGCTPEKPAGNKIRWKTADITSEIHIISGKATVASINGAGGSGEGTLSLSGWVLENF